MYMNKIITRVGKYIVDFIINVPTRLGTIQSVLFHTIFFIAFYTAAAVFSEQSDHIISLFTNILSIEAIYLSIFIQLSVNRNNDNVEQIREDVSEISENIDDIAEDVDELNENVDDIAEDVSEMSENIDDIAEDVDELNEDEMRTQSKNPSSLQSMSAQEKLIHLHTQLELIQNELATLMREI
jgi:methyl-accepting chemotaxis protein